MQDFWQKLGHLLQTSELIIDRPTGSHHPRYSSITYPLDYGYLAGTTAADGSGIDVWRGSLPEPVLDAVVCTVDILKRDTEVKLLLGCTPEEKELVLQFHQNQYMSAVMVRR
ncbi:inorganic pyrophosphatase [Candidatus Dependentiae bacterium]